MPELILPGTYIQVRPEALIVGGPISVGNIGIVGTARMGPVNEVQVLSSYGDALQIFGAYDPLNNPDTDKFPFTLTRALELAYANGASTVLAVRVTSASKATASLALGTVATVQAASPGVWGNGITAKVEAGDAGPPATAKVTLTLGAVQEVYSVTSGTDLIGQLQLKSDLAIATPGGAPDQKPAVLAETKLAGGKDGADAGVAEYTKALSDVLLNADAQIIVAAGLEGDAIVAALKGHVDQASTDEIKRDRIAVVGSPAATSTDKLKFITDLKVASSDRLVLVAPGITATDTAQATANTADPTHAVDPSVTLSGSYAAAAIAGMLSARDPHISLTNKTAAVDGLELAFDSGQLKQLVIKGVLALEDRGGIRVVKGITTDQGAFRQITTRRIVDYAKAGVRAAADPFIGLLNNDRVRKALKGSINGFLAGMIDDEMLESYELDVSATRDDEIRGIAKVTMTLRPTFSIDFVKVVMFLG